MIQEDFYATIKFKNGEEIFAKIAPTDDSDQILVTNPITISEVKLRGKGTGYKVEPWLKTSSDDLLIVSMDDILTVTESTDIEIINLHQKFVGFPDSVDLNDSGISRRMGYISSVSEAKKTLEKLYNNS